MKALFSTIGRKSAVGAGANRHDDAGFSSKDSSYAAVVAAKYKPQSFSHSPFSDATTSRPEAHNARPESHKTRPETHNARSETHSTRLETHKTIKATSFRWFGASSADIGDMPTSVSPQATSFTSTSASSPWNSKWTDTLKRRKDRNPKSIDSDNHFPIQPNSRALNGILRENPPSSYQDPFKNKSFLSETTNLIASDGSRLAPPIEFPSSQDSAVKRTISLRKRASHSSPSKERLGGLASMKHPPSSTKLSFLNKTSDPRNSATASPSGTSLHGANQRSPSKSDGASLPLDRSNSIVKPASAMNSADLATKLSELAVANGDGLLSDDEYRTLRQGLFEKMLQVDQEAMQVPSTHNLNGLSSVTPHQALSDFNSITRSPTNSKSSVYGDTRSTSIKSGKTSAIDGVSSFFKRSGIGIGSLRKQMSLDSRVDAPNQQADTLFKPFNRQHRGGGGGSASVSSLLSSGDSHSLRPPSTHTHHSNTAKSSRASTLSRFRVGSSNKRMQAEALASDLERSFSAARSARSLRAASINEHPSMSATLVGSCSMSTRSSLVPSSFSMRGGESSSAINALSGSDYCDKSSAEIRAEIAVVQAEGSKLMETFDGLEQTILAKSKLDTALLGRVVDQVQSTVRANVSLSTFSSLSSIKVNGNNHLIHSSVISAAAAPPSSFKPIKGVSHSRSSSVSSSFPIRPCSSNGRIQTFSFQDYNDQEETIDPESWIELESLKKQLLETFENKQTVVKRYQDRIAFLKIMVVKIESKTHLHSSPLLSITNNYITIYMIISLSISFPLSFSLFVSLFFENLSSCGKQSLFYSLSHTLSFTHCICISLQKKKSSSIHPPPLFSPGLVFFFSLLEEW